MLYLVFGKILNMLCLISSVIRQFFNVVDGQLLNMYSSHMVTLVVTKSNRQDKMRIVKYGFSALLLIVFVCGPI